VLWCSIPLSTITSWRSVLVVEETRVPGENHRSVSSEKLITQRCIEFALILVKNLLYLQKTFNIMKIIFRFSSNPLWRKSW